MQKTVEVKTMQIGNTTYYVAANFVGTVQLQHLIKRLIRRELEQKDCMD